MVLQLLFKTKHPKSIIAAFQPWTGYWILDKAFTFDGNSLERRKANDGESNQLRQTSRRHST